MNQQYNFNSEISEQNRGCCRIRAIGDNKSKINQQSCCKLSATNYLKNYETPRGANDLRVCEVRFKNDHKDFFTHTAELRLKEGEIVAVEAASGHDIGIVSLTGETALLQFRRKHNNRELSQLNKVYRHAKATDIEKWIKAIELEAPHLKRTRELVMSLGLEMKLNDVEYQGDRSKAIFYYTAEDRVDFRELIKKMAEEFRIRIEMRQIGMRQESAKLGGIGPCGRELCCASWMTDFKSVSTYAARVQQLSPNPQKLAGLCGKLKCCINYEYPAYAEAYEQFPDERTVLRTKKGDAVHQKSDIFKGLMWYTYTNDKNNIMAIPIEQVKNIAELNRNGIMPEKLEDYAFIKDVQALEVPLVGLEEGDLTRFDEPRSNKPKKNKDNNRRNA
jgi:cell fate regulator YaaT (PSP1 superfamily)